MLYEQAEGGAVRCRLCGHQCLIKPGKTGICRVRENVGGKLISLNYDALVAVNIDPIEKKPLFHFLPGSTSLSVAAAGCNFQCPFCQNWRISQAPRTGKILAGESIPPPDLVATAKRNDCKSMSFTYTEPAVFFELCYDTAREAHDAGIKNCFVSNGFMTPEAVQTISPYLDAINVDLKAFRDETYQRVMKGHLEPVLTCLKELVSAGIWVEVTTLVVPGMNDSEDELSDIAGFIAGDLGVDVPWHVSRFHGDYKMTDTPSTPMKTLDSAIEAGQRAGLRYLYCGNVPAGQHENTRCPNCGATLIRRTGFHVAEVRLSGARCPDCSTEIAGIWE